MNELHRLVEMEVLIDLLLLRVRGVAEEQVKRKIIEKTKNIKNAEYVIGQIENTYLDSLFTVKVPGITEGDKVSINRKTWVPEVYPLDNTKGSIEQTKIAISFFPVFRAIA